MLGYNSITVYIRFKSCQIFAVQTVALTFVGSNLL